MQFQILLFTYAESVLCFIFRHSIIFTLFFFVCLIIFIMVRMWVSGVTTHVMVQFTLYFYKVLIL